MRNSNFTINIIAVVYYRDDGQEEDPRYVQLDAQVIDSEIRRATFYLPYDKFNLKQIKKRCPWMYSYGKRKDIDLELAILLEDFLDRPDLDPVYERIIWSSTKLYDDVYSVQVQGTIEEDIPDYRKFGDEICVMAFTVSYSGSVYHVEVDPYSSYWPASSSYPALNYVNAMYKISMGITPKNLIWDDNNDTTNPKLPIYSM